eukprot:4289289-Prymnesium_polylepis.1
MWANGTAIFPSGGKVTTSSFVKPHIRTDTRALRFFDIGGKCCSFFGGSLRDARNACSSTRDGVRA